MRHAGIAIVSLLILTALVIIFTKKSYRSNGLLKMYKSKRKTMNSMKNPMKSVKNCDTCMESHPGTKYTKYRDGRPLTSNGVDYTRSEGYLDQLSMNIPTEADGPVNSSEADSPFIGYLIDDDVTPDDE